MRHKRLLHALLYVLMIITALIMTNTICDVLRSLYPSVFWSPLNHNILNPLLLEIFLITCITSSISVSAYYNLFILRYNLSCILVEVLRDIAYFKVNSSLVDPKLTFSLLRFFRLNLFLHIYIYNFLSINCI